MAHASVAYLDKHSTLDPVMVSDVNFGLKCKCDLIVKNSNALML